MVALCRKALEISLAVAAATKQASTQGAALRRGSVCVSHPAAACSILGVPKKISEKN